jgi:lipoic acid synthetase
MFIGRTKNEQRFKMPTPPARNLPRWLKRNVPKGNADHFTARLVRRLDLRTVCDHAKCPNRMECYARKTAAFMILGDVCTRNCGFCGVATGRPAAVDPDEPARIAQAAVELGLDHVVVTAVTRDDLPDGGSEHFCRTVRSIRRASEASVEVLPSDFAGNVEAVRRLVDARPDVYNLNCETVPRLFRKVRGPKASYRWTLDVFRRIDRQDPTVRTKTGLMLGLGETTGELFDTLADLADAGCGMLTLGQYLQPSPRHLPVERYVEPDEFDSLAAAARQIGFKQVAAGPFVRSSYHAREMVRG